MAPLFLQALREKSRSTIIYFLFSMLIVVFVWQFNTSGGSGGCQLQAVGTELATVRGETIDASLVQMAVTLTPETGKAGRPTLWDAIFDNTRFYNLAPIDLSGVLGETAGLQGAFALLGLFDRALQMPADSAAFKQVPALRYVGFRRPFSKLDRMLRVRAFNDLVENVLVGDEATELGLRVTDDEVNERILTKDWYDKVTKEFRKEDFKNYLNSLGVSTEQFKTFVKNEMLREKVIELVAGLTSVGSAEVDRLAADKNDSVKFEYVEVDAEKLASLVPVTAAEIDAQKKDLDAIKKYFEAHKGEFEKERTVTVRALMVKAPSADEIAKADAAKKPELEKQRADAEKKAKDAYQKLVDAAKPPAPPAEGEAPPPAPPAADPFERDQKAFQDIVKSDSDDASSKGDGGLYKGVMTKLRLEATFGKEVATSALGLNKGQYTDVVAGDKGFWILFADDATEAKTRSLEAATDEIAAALARQKKAPEWAKTVADEVLAEAKKDPKKALGDVVKAWNDAHRPAAAATPGGPDQPEPPKVGGDKPADQPTEPPAEPPAVEPPTGEKPAEPPAEPPAVVPPAGEKPAEPPAVEPPTAPPAVDPPAEPPVAPPAAEKPIEPPKPVEPPPTSFDGMLLASDSAPVSHASSLPDIWEYPRESDAIYKDADDSKKFDEDDDSWTEVPGAGKSAELKRALFALTAEKPVAEKVYAPGDGKKLYVVRFKERKTLEGAEAEKAKATLGRQLLARRQREAYRAWYASLLDKARADGDIKLTDTWTQSINLDWQAYQKQFLRGGQQ